MSLILLICGIAVVFGAVLTIQVAARGLGIGILLWLLLEKQWIKSDPIN